MAIKNVPLEGDFASPRSCGDVRVVGDCKSGTAREQGGQRERPKREGIANPQPRGPGLQIRNSTCISVKSFGFRIKYITCDYITTQGYGNEAGTT